MSTLNQRDWAVQVGNVLMRPGAPGRTLTVEFEVTKTTEREPNKATVKIYNLTPNRRDSLQELDNPQLQIIAGYRNLTDTIFVGDARDIWTYRDGVDRITEIESEDGGTAYRTATIQQSFAAGISVANVITACAAAMGVGIGNTASVAARAELETGGSIYPTGTTLSGVAWRQLNRVCTSAGLRWSVQNGVLQLRARGRAAEVRAIRLTPATGLIGSPTRGKRDERTGRVTYGAKSQLIRGIYPGRAIVIQSSETAGNFLCKRARYSGSTTGDDWSIETELTEYTT